MFLPPIHQRNALLPASSLHAYYIPRAAKSIVLIIAFIVYQTCMHLATRIFFYFLFCATISVIFSHYYTFRKSIVFRFFDKIRQILWYVYKTAVYFSTKKAQRNRAQNVDNVYNSVYNFILWHFSRKYCG